MKIKSFVTIISIAFLVGFAGLFATQTQATQQEKVNLCHQTSSEDNPWVVQSVNANEVQSHLDNGDFYYTGEFGIHTQEAKNWCANHQVTPTPTPTVTPECEEDCQIDTCLEQECVTPTPTEEPRHSETPTTSSTNAPSAPVCTIAIDAPLLQGFEKTSESSVKWHWWGTHSHIVSQWVDYGYSQGNYPYSVVVPTDATEMEIGSLDPNADQNWARVGVMDEHGCVAFSNDLDP